MLIQKYETVGAANLEDNDDFSLMSVQSRTSQQEQTVQCVATKRVLFIDDELHVCKVVQACLETLGGWDVLLAASGQEGLVMAATEKPDAILLDVMMPEMDGLAVLKQLQANPLTQSIPVVLLTARASLLEQPRFSQLGVKGAIAKPFNSLTLVPQIAKALGWNLETQD